MPKNELGAGHTIVLANLVTGAALVLAGVMAIFWLIPGYVTGANVDQGTIGPGFMPRLAAGATAILGATVAGNAVLSLLRGDIDGDSHEDSEENEFLTFGRNEIVNTVILAAIATVYTLLFSWIGFLAASVMLLVFLIYATGYRNIYVVVTIAVVLPVGLKQLFWHILHIPLPEFPRVLF